MTSSALTIDVDSLRHYRAIHGLGSGGAGDRAGPDAAAIERDPIYTVAMPRFWELVSEAGVPATLFLIGADAPSHAAAFVPVARTGSEVASHSFAHDYRLTRQAPEAIRADLARADEVLRPLNANRPIEGFRAPGYNVNARLLEAVRGLGYRYDSSLLPSPLYFAARAAAIAAYAALGRPSRSLAGDVRQFLGRADPFRTAGLVEIPMAVDPLTRVPLFGTSWSMAPRRLQDNLLSRALRKLPCLVFEMHAIDLLDRTDGPELAALARHQRDLAVPAAEKLASFRRLFAALRDGTEVLTLATIAARH